MTTFENLLNLQGRHALITGATQGIGRSIAQRLTQAGAEVVLHCRDAVSYTHLTLPTKRIV